MPPSGVYRLPLRFRYAGRQSGDSRGRRRRNPRSRSGRPPPRSPLGVSRRQVLTAGGTGLLAATASASRAAARTRRARAPGTDGTPEQIHLTWGENPATSVVVSWASAGQAARAAGAHRAAGHPGRAPRSTPTGSTARRSGPTTRGSAGCGPARPTSYSVTADNDANAADPFSATFRTAPDGRAAFRFTSFGDLATPNTQWVLSYGQSAYAVDAVESFQPLFHLLNGDLCYAEPEPGRAARGVARLRQQQPGLGGQPAVDAVPGQPRGRVRQRPAGIHLVPDQLHAARQPGTRLRRALVLLPGRLGPVRLARRRRRGVPGRGRVRGGPGAALTDPGGTDPAQAGNPPIEPGTSFYIRGYSGGAQTAWLERTLAAGRGDQSIDWIIVQMHQCAAVLLGHRERLRSGHPRGMAAAVRPVPGGPGAERPRPRLRAVVPGARRRRRRRPRGRHRRRGQHACARTR